MGQTSEAVKVKLCKDCRTIGINRPAAPGRNICYGHHKRRCRGVTGEAYFAPIGVEKFPIDPRLVHRIKNQQWDYDAGWALFCDYIGIHKPRRAKVPASPRGKVVNYGVLADLHVPFHNLRALESSVKYFQKCKVAEVILAGDVPDCYSLSKYTQYEAVPIQKEFIETRKILDWLSRVFNRVTVLSGNHPDRESKYLAARLPPDLFTWFYRSSFMERVTADMENVRIEKRQVQGTNISWFTTRGDALIGHPERSSRIPLRVVDWFNDWALKWHTIVKIPIPRLVVAGHTHAAGITWVGPTQIVEAGCACLVQGYALKPNMYPKPQREACVVFSQENGKTIPNSVQLYYTTER